MASLRLRRERHRGRTSGAETERDGTGRDGTVPRLNSRHANYAETTLAEVVRWKATETATETAKATETEVDGDSGGDGKGGRGRG